ncbi:type II CAAX prenyl endopeptidase Rce1 family protein [Corynebacterium sp. LK2522]|uniref:CPBP family glutamic-type intramembrane protease n=1 Tax=Corynebacterium sp. LK2522 TaxID=3110474 RepID=UPI002A930325|nr:CPBP family intramembrane metalloprotease [Mycobacteriaceae bacterium]MDY5829727.1 CPBP family intramembrane glutamic endopeptidase [Corynebacterium sp.]
MDELTQSSFHRVLPGRWWRPLLEAAVFIVIAVVFFFGFALVAGLSLGGEAIDAIDDMSRPGPFAVSLGLLIALGAAAWVAASICRRGRNVPAARRGARGLWSVAGRVRWGLAGRAVLPAVVAWAVAYLPITVIEGNSPRWDSTAAVLLALTVTLVPLQALSEELVFRALLPQWLGRWIRSPWLAYLPGFGLFIAGHAYDAKGLAAIAVFAAAATVLTWSTGGIEAAAVVHAVGNVLAFSSAAVGISDPNNVEVSWASVAAEVVFSVGATVWTLYLVRRRPQLVAASPAGLPVGPREWSATGAAPQPPAAQRPPRQVRRPDRPE